MINPFFNSFDTESILRNILGNTVYNLGEEIFGDEVEPAIGSVVYCKLLRDLEHSGIYVGNREIVHLNGDGIVEKVNGEEFCGRLGGLNPAFHVYCPIVNKKSVGSIAAAERANRLVGSRREYNIVKYNCHCFTASCLTGEEKTIPSFKMLEILIAIQFGSFRWKITNLY